MRARTPVHHCGHGAGAALVLLLLVLLLLTNFLHCVTVRRLTVAVYDQRQTAPIRLSLTKNYRLNVSIRLTCARPNLNLIPCVQIFNGSVHGVCRGNGCFLSSEIRMCVHSRQITCSKVSENSINSLQHN